MAEVTIVTAFFDVGRKEWKGFERDNNKYIEYFRFWARIQNKLIVYTDQETAEKVLEIRDSFNLKDRTKVVIIDDVYTLEPEVYKAIENALSNESAVKFRDMPNNPEAWNPRYDYVTFLKPYFVADAIRRNFADGVVSWLDFGYNHAGEICTEVNEFNFLWQFDCSTRIHMFATEELDDMPVFEIVRTMRAYIAGAIMLGPANLWSEFAQLYKESMLHLTHCGFADDDQTLSVMAYRKKPELFEIHFVEDFFSGLKQVGGEHLTIKKIKKQYKETKKQAKISWKKGQFTESALLYMKYTKEKLQDKK